MFNDDPYKLQRAKRPVATPQLGVNPQLGATSQMQKPALTRSAVSPVAQQQLGGPKSPPVAPTLTPQRTIAAFAPAPYAERPDLTHPPRPGQNFATVAPDSAGVLRKPDGYVSKLDPSVTPPKPAQPQPTLARQNPGNVPLVGLGGGDIKTLTPQTPFDPSLSITNAPVPGAPARNLSIAPSPAQPGANAAKPGEVGLSEKTFKPLPGAPIVGAQGEVVYDDAFMAKNPGLIKRYAQQNVVQSVVPPPGVAQGMMGGGTPQVGSLRRADPGYTAADRMAQLDALDALGRSNAEGRARDTATKASAGAARAAGYGEFDRAAALGDAARTAGGLSQGLQRAPRIGQTDPNAAARLGIDQQRVGIEAQQAAAQTENTQLQTQGMRMQQEQAQKAQALTDQLINGTPEQKQQAGAALAVMQGTKPGELIKVKTMVPTGVDFNGQPVMMAQEVLYNQQTGEWKSPPAASGGPPQEAIAELQANPSAEMRAYFKQTFGVDPAQFVK